MNSAEIENGIKHLSANDPHLAKIIAGKKPIILEKHRRYFESLVKAIVGQQLSTNSAHAINTRLKSYFNHSLTPDAVFSAPYGDLRKLGLSNAKVKYVKDLASKLLNKQINLKRIDGKSDKEIIDELTAVKGIGVWTVHMFLIFTLARQNVLPAGDLGLKRAIMRNYGMKSLPDEEKILRLSKRFKWPPFNTLASLYLWQTLES